MTTAADHGRSAQVQAELAKFEELRRHYGLRKALAWAIRTLEAYQMLLKTSDNLKDRRLASAVSAALLAQIEQHLDQGQRLAQAARAPLPRLQRYA